VYIYDGTFTKETGGIIYGSDASGTLKNTASGYVYGHAVYATFNEKRNTTVGEGVTLDSTKSGAEGGWADPMPGNLSLNESLEWLSANAAGGGAYTVTLSANETVAPKTLSYGGKNVTITLDGGTAERTVSLSSSGSLFTVESGVTLILGNNITLQGRSGNTDALVRVDNGKLEMNSGSKISGNTNSYFSSNYGGGVYVTGGTFTMSGGEISGNTASSSYSSSGGGVYVSDGTFTMNGGEISGNTASHSSYSFGGGVYVAYGTFTMNGGEISGNTSSSSYGGGVYVAGGTFTMSGGAISGNTAGSGGGVSVNSGTFTMNNGTISGNTASNYGGGVYAHTDGTFTKQSGGIIYGSNADSTLKNTTTSGNSYGHAVSAYSGSRMRNTTVGEGVTLDSTKSGAAGGWVDQ
jgi:hypothetical protein